jgi:hypothetical protein
MEAAWPTQFSHSVRKPSWWMLNCDRARNMWMPSTLLQLTSRSPFVSLVDEELRSKSIVRLMITFGTLFNCHWKTLL